MSYFQSQNSWDTVATQLETTVGTGHRQNPGPLSPIRYKLFCDFFWDSQGLKSHFC